MIVFYFVEKIKRGEDAEQDRFVFSVESLIQVIVGMNTNLISLATKFPATLII